MDITIGDFPKLRTRTRELAAKLQPRLDDHLQMVKEQFRPAAVFGSAVSPGAKDAKDGGLVMAQFRKAWTDVAVSLNVSEDLPEGLGLNSAKPILCPFVYRHRITTPEGGKDVTVKNPLRFILTYPDYPYDALLGLLGAPDKRNKLREFALHYTALNFIVTQNRKLLALFEDLRYPVGTEKNERLGSMPITTLTAPYATARPSDDVIALICDFSGSDTIEEVVDADPAK